MPEVPLALAAGATLAIWLYLLLFRGGFWREFARRDATPALSSTAPRVVAVVPARDEADVAPPAPLSAAPRIVAVVPARDEAGVVARAIGSLAAQRAPGYFHIVLVDDHSSDGTAASAEAAAERDLLTVIPAAPLPPGWKGKLWAVAEGVRHAATLRPDYLLLTDADIVHAPQNVAHLAARAEAEGYDLVSYMATLSCDTPAERALVPAFVFFFFLLYPPAWIRNSQRATAGAAGGCMLIRRESLARVGGIGAIRGAWIDDCALARAMKRRGGKVWLGVSEQTRSMRGYADFREAGRMISRSAFTQLHHSAWLLAATVAGLLLTYAAPPALALAATGSARWLGAAAWLIMAFCYWPAVRFFGRPAYEAACLPLVALFYLGATVHSAWGWWRGGGGRWKGRRQPVS